MFTHSIKYIYLEDLKHWTKRYYISKNKIYGRKKSQEFLNKLKSNNICIHVYTFNKENISRGFKTLDEEILYFKEKLKVNGIFKD